jgi:PTS system mannose-specific IIA component
MIGIVIVSHLQLGESLIQSVSFVIGKPLKAAASVSINKGEDSDKVREKIAAAIKAVNQRSGVLILTDMFGGTPSNLSHSFLKEGQIEVLSGVNMPILIQADALRRLPKMNISRFAKELESYGKEKSIRLASSILKGNEKNGD